MINNVFLKINAEKKADKIIKFLKETFEKQKKHKSIIGLSGGIDSITSFYLLRKVLPSKNIIVAHLYYNKSEFSKLEKIIKVARIPQNNIYNLSIKKPVDELMKLLNVKQKDKIRIGNIMARVRMIILYDLAKKNNALVCGTENRSEHLLGYFTRFGDAASDIEPIMHLYKTEVFRLAANLGVSEEFIRKAPTADLWEGQTDEGEFGFSYKEADQVLHLYFDKKLDLNKIKKMGFGDAERVIKFALRNQYKQKTPYTIK